MSRPMYFTRAAGLLLLSLSMFTSAFVSAAGFTMKDTDGNAHQLAQYRGKWVLVNFWATWCPPCVAEIPELSALYQARKSELQILGVAMDYESEQGVIDFAKEHGMRYPLVLGSERIAAQVGKVKVLPATFLYDPNGNMVLKRIGPITREEIEKVMAAGDAAPALKL